MKKKSENIVVEVQLNDGSMSMEIGRLVSRTEKRIRITDAAFIASTGRRHLFFAGAPDSNTEIEPYPDGMIRDLPAVGSIVSTWPHPLPRKAV